MAMKMLLQQQTVDKIVTISTNKSPVIRVSTDYSFYVDMIVNFLRSGCPSVQIVSAHKQIEEDEYVDLSERLCSLQIDKERFNCERNGNGVFTVTLT